MAPCGFLRDGHGAMITRVRLGIPDAKVNDRFTRNRWQQIGSLTAVDDDNRILGPLRSQTVRRHNHVTVEKQRSRIGRANALDGISQYFHLSLFTP